MGRTEAVIAGRAKLGRHQPFKPRFNGKKVLLITGASNPGQSLQLYRKPGSTCWNKRQEIDERRQGTYQGTHGQDAHMIDDMTRVKCTRC